MSMGRARARVGLLLVALLAWSAAVLAVPAPASAVVGDSWTFGPFTYVTAPGTITATEVNRRTNSSGNHVLSLTTSTWNGPYDVYVWYRCSATGSTVYSAGNTQAFGGGPRDHAFSQCGTAPPSAWGLGQYGTTYYVQGTSSGVGWDQSQDPGEPPGLAAGNCVLSDLQLAGLARAAGWTTTEDVTIAVAVALAESSGRVNALNRNPSPVSYDLGLWQVNDRAHPTYDRTLLGTNPFYNAQAARAIYLDRDGGSWDPWVAYTSGSYSKYLDRATTAATRSTLALPLSDCSGGTDPTAVPGDPVTGETCTGLDLGCWLRWAFVPDDATFARFDALGGEFAGSFPFSLLTDTWDLLDIATNGCRGYGTGGECSSDMSLGLDLGPLSPNGETMRLLDEDSPFASQLAGWRPALNLGMWLLSLAPIGIYVWRKLFPVVEE